MTRPRRLSATFYVEWVLGVLREQAALQCSCARSTRRAAPCSPAAPGRVISPGASPSPTWRVVPARSRPTAPSSWAATARRTRPPLSAGSGSPTGPGELLRPCAALMTGLELPPGGEDVVVFLLGQAETEEDARRLVRFYGEAGRARQRAGGGHGADGIASSGPFKSARPTPRWI